jgi:hypothetical protein
MRHAAKVIRSLTSTPSTVSFTMRSIARVFSLHVAIACAALFSHATSVRAAIVVTEVSPWSSGSSSFAADWFELTNNGTSAVEITGWKFDDNSNSTASAVALNGVTSIAPGESVVFLESSTPATTIAAFNSVWFGGNAPAGLQIGTYTGSGVGLGTAGDAVNIFNAENVPQANVSFGASPVASPFATFDNAAGTTGTISQLSVVGVNGAFQVNDTVSGNSIAMIGSPGSITAVPEPSSLAFLLCVGAGSLYAKRRKKLVIS